MDRVRRPRPQPSGRHIELWFDLTKVLEAAAEPGRWTSNRGESSYPPSRSSEHLDPSPFWFGLCERRLRASATDHEWRARLSVGSVSRGHFVLDRKLENTLVPAGVVVQALLLLLNVNLLNCQRSSGFNSHFYLKPFKKKKKRNSHWREKGVLRERGKTRSQLIYKKNYFV